MITINGIFKRINAMEVGSTKIFYYISSNVGVVISPVYQHSRSLTDIKPITFIPNYLVIMKDIRGDYFYEAGSVDKSNSSLITEKEILSIIEKSSDDAVFEDIDLFDELDYDAMYFDTLIEAWRMFELLMKNKEHIEEALKKSFNYMDKLSNDILIKYPEMYI